MHFKNLIKEIKTKPKHPNPGLKKINKKPDSAVEILLKDQ